MSEAPTARGRRTRESLLTATAELVAERGFHAVGIADIGHAAGVSGAAIYRHFASKDDLLVAVFEHVVGELLDGARRAVDEERSPTETLRAFVDAHIEFALANRTVIKVYDQEAHNLPTAERTRVRRQQRTYTNLWIGVVHAVHPHWPDGEVATSVHGVFGLINSVADYRSGATTVAAPKLRAMARAALEV